MPAERRHAETPSTVADPYALATAEFYDLLATAHWESFGSTLGDLLVGVDPADGPLVDIGAGTGVGIPAIRAAVPGVSIHAIEPSRAMRTALHTRLAVDPGLCDAVTVDPRPWGAARPPERACAVLVSAALGHLDAGERQSLWRYVAEQVAPGAPAIVEVLPPERPLDVLRQRYRERRVGTFTYEGWQRGRAIDDRRMMWTMEYRVVDGDEVVAEYEVTSEWTCCSIDDVRAEIAPFGLESTAYDDCVVVRRAVR